MLTIFLGLLLSSSFDGSMSSTGSGDDPTMWGFTVKWEFKANCTLRSARVYQFERKLVCREICDPVYCSENVVGNPRNPTLGSVRRKKVAVLYNAKICFQQTEIEAKKNGCYDHSLFQDRLSFYNSWGGDPYPFRDHAWSSPGGSCTDACSEKSMVCSLDLPYPDVIETIAQQECDVVLLFEQFKGIHQPGFEVVSDKARKPVCQGIKNKDTSRWTLAHTTSERCNARKEGFVRLCWCSRDEHVYQFTPLEPTDQVSPRRQVHLPFRPHPAKSTTWCVKFAPKEPDFQYDIFSFREKPRKGINIPRISLTLTANWDSIWFVQQFVWVSPQGVLRGAKRSASWSIPYSYKNNYWRSKDLMRFVCIRFDMISGNLTLWYKQPGHFMVPLTPSSNSILPYKTYIRSGTVALGQSLVSVDGKFRPFGGLFVYALFTDMFHNDTSFAHSTYNCMIPHLFSDWPLLARDTRFTVTWADFSPVDPRLNVTGVTVLDRFSRPDIITPTDVCGACFVEERDNLTWAVQEMVSTRNNNDTKTFCEYVSRAMLLWEDNAFCWQVDHTSGAASFGTKTQPYPKMISAFNDLRLMGLDPKVRCSSILSGTVQQDYTPLPVPRPTGGRFTVTTPFTLNETVTYYTTTVPGPSHQGTVKKLTRTDCAGEVVTRCSGFTTHHTWWYWKELFYAFPFSGTPWEGDPWEGMSWKPAKHPRNDCDLFLFQLICFQSIDSKGCQDLNVRGDISNGILTAKRSLRRFGCDQTHLQWRDGRMSDTNTDLEVCSIWNLSECRWRHLVGGRFSQYFFTSDLYRLWEAEINDFKYSLEEESCTHRQEYTQCLDRLKCTNHTMSLYNSTNLAEKLFAELRQFNYVFYMQAISKFIRGEWCRYADPLNRVHSDCITCFSLLRHLNTTTNYWNSYLRSMEVYNYRDCVGPHCYVQGTAVPPNYSESIYWEEAWKLHEIVEKEKAEKIGNSGEFVRWGGLVLVSTYIAAFT